MRFFFEALNVGQIPIDLVDVLAQVNCRYFDGCLIVEVHDHRRPTQEPKTKKQRVSNLLTWSSFSNSSTPDTSNRIPPSPSTNPSETAKIPEPGSTAINGLKVDGAQRPAAALTNGTVTDGELASETPVNSSPDANSSKVYKKVMRPTSETINLDLLLACERSRTKLSPDDVLELESMVLLAIEEPLDLEPDVQVSRVSNAIRFVEYGHLLPSKRRKYNSAEIEAEQAEREEKLKLLTLMDDRKSREFQPSFNRVSQVNEWRHKKYVNDAEVYPAAVPSVSLGKKPPTKKNRSQMSLFSDGRRVIRTLRFVQTTSGRSTHTVFHVLELPDNNGLQGIMRWGTLPDTSINGGSRTFSFPNEEIMRMHIDNFKLLLGIENNRLIYDSIYPNGVPTSGPPPTSPTVAAPSTLNGASSSAEAPVSASVSVSSPTVTNAPVSSVSPSKAASPTTETESQSPIVAASSPTASETPKQKSASAAKNSIRNSRIKSPQPKQKKSASNNKDSTEPEDKASREKSASVGAQKAKSTGSTKSKSKSKSSAASQDTKPPSKDADADKDTQDAREITSTDSVKDTDDVGDRDNTPASSLQTDQASAEPEALKYAINTEPDNTSAATTGKKAQAKGGAKTQRKKAAPKEKKSKVKPKSAGAKGAKDATSKSKAGDVESASPVPATGDAENIAAGDGQNAAKQNINTSQGVTSAAANGNLLSMSPMVSNANIPAQSQAAAVSQTSLLNAALGLSSQTNPSAQAMQNMPFELPKHITKEYLQANPHYYAILRNHMTALVKQKQQQQQAGMPNVGSPNPLGSPQMRPGVPLNAATVAQMFQAMQGANEASSNGAGGVGAGSPANASASSANMSAAIGSIPPGDTPTLVASPVGMATSQAPPGFTSPAMRPNTMPPNAAAVPPGLQNLAPTKEEIILIQNYCRLFEVPFQNIQAPQLAMLIRLAKTGELRQAIMSRLQTISHNHQSANTGGNRTMANSSNSHSNATDSANLRQQQPQHFVNATTSVQSSPVVSSALPMNAGGAGLPGNPASSNAQTTNPMQLPPELANLPPTEKIKLLEAFIQRQRAVAMNNPGAHIQGPATSASQQALQAAIALQQQRNAAAGGGSLGATTSGAVANPATLGTQAPAMRPMRPNPGATATMQPRPLAAMMGSPTPAPSVPGSAPMGLPTGQ
ncbi:Transcription factor spt20, partial [Coemansia sp. RSA 1285]